MKKVVVSLMLAFAMVAVSSCACSNSKSKESTECTKSCDAKGDCKGYDAKTHECAGCDSTSVKDSCCKR